MQRQAGSSTPAGGGMKSLIRRHTVMRRSTKRSSTKSSRKRHTSTSTTGPPTASLFLSRSFNSNGRYHRKGSAMSASSAPIPKSPKASAALAQRRRSAFPEFGLVAHRHHRSSSKSRHSQPHYSTIHRSFHHHHSNPFTHLPPPRHRRSASTCIRQHLLPPLDRPPAPVPPESDLQVEINFTLYHAMINNFTGNMKRFSFLFNSIPILISQVNEIGGILNGGSNISDSGSISRAASAVNGRTSVLPGEVPVDQREPRPHSDMNGTLNAWSPTPSLLKQVRSR